MDINTTIIHGVILSVVVTTLIISSVIARVIHNQLVETQSLLYAKSIRSDYETLHYFSKKHFAVNLIKRISFILLAYILTFCVIFILIDYEYFSAEDRISQCFFGMVHALIYFFINLAINFFLVVRSTLDADTEKSKNKRAVFALFVYAILNFIVCLIYNIDLFDSLILSVVFAFVNLYVGILTIALPLNSTFGEYNGIDMN